MAKFIAFGSHRQCAVNIERQGPGDFEVTGKVCNRHTPLKAFGNRCWVVSTRTASTDGAARSQAAALVRELKRSPMCGGRALAGARKRRRRRR